MIRVLHCESRWDTGVARIFSGLHFSCPKKLTTFSVVAYEINHSHRTDLQISSKIGLSVWGCTLSLGVHLQLSTVNLPPPQFFLRSGGARAPSAPPGYAYAVKLFSSPCSMEALSVLVQLCPSIRPFVTLVRHVKTAQHIITLFFIAPYSLVIGEFYHINIAAHF